jgi:hypothetical protein
MTGAELAQQAIDGGLNSIIEINTLTTLFEGLRAEDRRLAKIDHLGYIARPDPYAAVALRGLFLEPERVWSIAKNVLLPTHETFGEVVLRVAPHLDGDIPNRETTLRALGLALDEARGLKELQDQIDRPPGEAGSTKSEMQSFTEQYRNPTLGDNTAVSDFSMADITDALIPSTIYFVVTPDTMQIAATYMRLFVTLLVNRNVGRLTVL